MCSPASFRQVRLLRLTYEGVALFFLSPLEVYQEVGCFSRSLGGFLSLEGFCSYIQLMLPDDVDTGFFFSNTVGGLVFSRPPSSRRDETLLASPSFLVPAPFPADLLGARRFPFSSTG